MLIYGGSSIKKNGVYDQAMSILAANPKTVFEDAGVMPCLRIDLCGSNARLLYRERAACAKNK